MKDRTELGNSERFIIKKVESLYDEWQIFTQFINTENDDLQKTKIASYKRCMTLMMRN